MSNKVNYYSIIPAVVRYDSRLTPNSKLLYGEITALCNERGYCWASNSYFAELYKVDKNSISRWINQLVEFGYVKVELNYKEGSKEVESRFIYLSFDSPTPHHNFVDTPHHNFVDTPPQFCGYPPHKNVVVNTTTNNTINNTKNRVESSSPVSASSKKDSKLFRTEGSTGNKKVDKWLNRKMDIVDNYEFSGMVTTSLYKFLKLLAEMNALVPDVTIESQLNKLIEKVPNELDRFNIIESTITRGWKSLDYMINEFTKSKTANFDTAKNSQNQFYTEEQKKQMREEYQNASEDDLF